MFLEISPRIFAQKIALCMNHDLAYVYADLMIRNINKCKTGIQGLKE
jgi:hypothetical protein